MSRLSDSDKSQIIELYRQSGETTLTLAERYGVSNTTISRILKSSLSADEYDGLIQQKRSASRGGSKTATTPIEAPPVQGNLLEVVEPAPKKLKLKAVEPKTEPEIAEPESVEPVKTAVSSKPMPPRRVQRQTATDEERPPIDAPAEKAVQVNKVEAIDPEDLMSNTGGMMDDDDDLEDDLDDLDNLDEDLDDDDDEPAILPSIQLNAAEFIRVLPIAEAAIPRTCYLVVDRAAELVARPLSEFAELGQIPSGEVEERTLPVFDNHRVAKRFSNIRTQRVIKVPDSRVLQKAAPYLQAKGITRLLIDGQVYAL